MYSLLPSGTPQHQGLCRIFLASTLLLTQHRVTPHWEDSALSPDQVFFNTPALSEVPPLDAPTSKGAPIATLHFGFSRRPRPLLERRPNLLQSLLLA
jgi:hypothetical protein